jgi:phosphoribosylamine-glycine ligase
MANTIAVYSKSGDFAPLAMRTPGGIFFANHDPRFHEKEPYKGLAKVYKSLGEILADRPSAIVFDMTTGQVPPYQTGLNKPTLMGPVADKLRAMGYPVWGGGMIQDLLEADREFGMRVMHENGIRIPWTIVFTPKGKESWESMLDLPEDEQWGLHEVSGDLDAAIDFVQECDLTWVFKPSGDGASSLTYVARNTEDMIHRLEDIKEHGDLKPGTPFLLQEKLRGVELSTEWLVVNGEPHLTNATIETKKFLADERGPNTGCQTSVCWMYNSPQTKIVKETMGNEKFRSWLKNPIGPKGEKYASYHGSLDLNCIISEEDGKPYGLEWTPRHGYSAAFCLLELIEYPLDQLFAELARGTLPQTVAVKPGYAYSVRVSIPPYPMLDQLDEKKYPEVARQMLQLATDINILGPIESPHVWLLDAKRYEDGAVKTAGIDGVVMEVTGYATSVQGARDNAHALLEQFDIADYMARTADGADRAIKQIPQLQAWGYEVGGTTVAIGGKPYRAPGTIIDMKQVELEKNVEAGTAKLVPASPEAS